MHEFKVKLTGALAMKEVTPMNAPPIMLLPTDIASHSIESTVKIIFIEVCLRAIFSVELTVAPMWLHIVMKEDFFYLLLLSSMCCHVVGRFQLPWTIIPHIEELKYRNIFGGTSNGLHICFFTFGAKGYNAIYFNISIAINYSLICSNINN